MPRLSRDARTFLPALLAVALAIEACAPAVPTGFDSLFAGQTGGHRWTEGRSHFDDVYRPFDPDRVEGPRDPEWLEGRLYLAEERGEPLASLARAHFLLWRNQPGDVDRAKGRLAGLPRDASSWNERALAGLAAGDLFLALESASRALALEPSDLPALFNRAVVLERLRLVHGAEEAWAAYLDRDPSSGWGQEASARLEGLRARAKPKGAAGADDARRMLFDDLRGTRSAADLDELLARPATRALLADLAAAGDRLAEVDVAARRSFDEAEWSRAVTRARQVQEQKVAATGAGPSEAILDGLERAPEPSVSLLALRIRAFDAILRRPPKEALALLDRVIARCEELHCRVEGALARSDQASLYVQGGDHRRAELALREAFDLLPPGLDGLRAEFLGKKAILAAETGQARRSIEIGLEAAEALVETGDRGFFAAVLGNLGSQAVAVGLPSVSLAYYRESILLAREAGRLSSELFAMGGAARALSDLGEMDASYAMIDEALSVARENEQSNALVTLLVSAGRLYLRGGRGPDASRLALEAAELATVMDQPQRRERALSLAGEAFATDGEREEAKRLLAGAIALNTESLGSIRGPIARALRLSARAKDRARYARLLAEDGDPAAGWGLLGGAPLRPLEEDECAIALVALAGDLLVWSATSAGTRFDAMPFRPEEPVPVFSERRCPEGTGRVTVIENEATVAGVGNRSVRLARPGVRVVVARRADTPWPSRHLQGAGLAVHDPRPVITDEPLPPLPGAPKEARLVLDALPGSLELSGSLASPREVAAVASRFELIHFGVHAQSRDHAGASSHLVLAGEDGFLQVVDVLELPLRERRPVVVLSACRGGGEVFEKETDGAGLPWAFLEAGAEAVIAYQDSLDDRAALDFSAAFYPLVGAGEDVEVAFERAVESLRVRWPAEVVASFAFYL